MRPAPTITDGWLIDVNAYAGHEVVMALNNRSFGLRLNRASLGTVLKRVREGRDLSLREAAAESGLDAATHCRAERGARLDYDTSVRLCRWAGFPVEAFAVGGARRVSVAGLPTPDLIEVTVHADPDLKPETAAALALMMRAAYSALTTGRKGSNSCLQT